MLKSSALMSRHVFLSGSGILLLNDNGSPILRYILRSGFGILPLNEGGGPRINICRSDADTCVVNEKRTVLVAPNYYPLVDC